MSSHRRNFAASTSAEDAAKVDRLTVFGAGLMGGLEMLLAMMRGPRPSAEDVRM
jgi:hypothetical protein